jgi:Domain of unknown function (DUF4234)
MAYDINIGQTQAIVRVRRPWAVVLLSILTLGVYSAVWYYKVNREMRDYGLAGGDSELAESKPVRSVLAVTIGSVLVIPVFVSYVRMVGRVQRVERIATGGSRAGAGLIVLLIGSTALSFLAGLAGTSALELLGAAVYLTAYALIQSRLNTVWQQSGDVADPVAMDTLGLADRWPADMVSVRERA